MAKEMLINVSEGEECRIALVENGRLEELYVERASATSHVGNIYKGRVTNVEPSIQAAFVDFGLGRNGFLHISDLMPSYFGRRGEDVQESVGRKLARRDRPPIQRCLRRGDDIIVQIIKEGIGTKGPTLTTYLSIPGRILVMMPGMSKLGVSRKIEDDEERRRLRQILDSLKPLKDCGFIIRTAGVGKTKLEIQKDLSYLTRLWQNMDKKIASGPGPIELYTEGDLVTRTVRDVFTADIERIIVDSKEVARRVKDFIKIALPRTGNKVELYENALPLFHKYGIEREIELMYSRHVPLPSGGSLVIDSTEAVVAIDVNSGKFRDHTDAEMTAFKTDMEAANEIPRQLRLRDLGGVIICDFIDLRYERHRRDLEKRLHENLHNDRAKTKMLRMSQFGIIEMTRQRMRPSLKRSIYFDCPHCKGAGLVKTPESMALDVMRRLAIAANDARVQRIDLAVCPDVDFYLQNRKRAAIAGIESACNKRILIRTDGALAMDDVRFTLYDARDGMVYLESLGMVSPAAAAAAGRGAPHGPHRQPAPARGEQHGRQRPQDERRHRREPEPEERFDIAEEEVDEREVQLLEGTAQEADIAAPPPSAESAEDIAPAADELAEDDDRQFERADELDEPQASQPEDAGPETTLPVATPPRLQVVRPPSPQQASDQRRDRPHGRRRGRRGRGRGRHGDAARTPAAETSPATVPAGEPQAEPEHVGVAPPPVAVVPAQSPAVLPVQAVGTVEPAAEQAAPVVEDAEPAAEQPKRRRRGSRGGRSRRSKKALVEVPADAATENVSGASPSDHAPRPAARPVAADRHLVRDEPVLPQPVLRPRTYRDLDSIPDDFD